MTPNNHLFLDASSRSCTGQSFHPDLNPDPTPFTFCPFSLSADACRVVPAAPRDMMSSLYSVRGPAQDATCSNAYGHGYAKKSYAKNNLERGELRHYL